MRIYFNEIYVKATKRWQDEDGKKHQKTKKFYQTLNPFNVNPDGTAKTSEEIWKEITAQRDAWLKS